MDYCVSADFDCQLLYFTSSGCLKQDRGIVFIGEEQGQPNLYYKDFLNGQISRLTGNQDGTLKSYVYFNGTPDRGFGKASACFSQKTETAYFIQGRSVCAADLSGNVRVLNTLPEGQVTAFTHVSGDGKRLCVPSTDSRALEAPHREGPATLSLPFDIDARVQKEELCSWIHIYDTETGEELRRERVPKAWITHVQFHPYNSDLILYNHEWPSFCGIRRMWLWDGTHHQALRTIKEGRSLHDWVCHEMWDSAGENIIYHGQYADSGLYYVGRIHLADGSVTEIPLPENYRCYGHFTLSSQDLLVSDGYYQAPLENPEKAQWISLQIPDWESGQLSWIPLEKHDSSWATQDAHPHPIFNPEGNRIYYTTDRQGRREILSCAVPR